MPRTERFTEQEIPYDDLAKFGLTQEMIDSLPKSVMIRLLSGYETPPMPLNRKTVDGVDVDSYARLQLVRNSDGTVGDAYMPRWESNELEQYTPEQQQLLKEGKVTTASLPGKGLCFIQYDETIRQVIAVPASIIKHNVDTLTSEVSIGRDGYEKLMNGEVVQRDTDKDSFSLGVDLIDDMGVRIAHGTAEEWREEAKAARLPRYNFGLYGCWMSDDFGILTYVNEDDYTEEMEAEFQRKMGQNAAVTPWSGLKGIQYWLTLFSSLNCWEW